VSDRAYRRFTRYAAFSVLHGLIVVLAVVGLAGPDPGLVVLVASIPLLFAWGAYQGDIALNPLLDEAGRTRWRIGGWCLPWSMALYWHRHIRARRPGD